MGRCVAPLGQAPRSVSRELVTVRVAHVVRQYGGLTEPFIADRVDHDLDNAELWCEQMGDVTSSRAVRHVSYPFLRPGTIGDRAFHRFPAIGSLLARRYGDLERAHRPEVIHAHYLTTGWLVGSGTRAPLVVSTYGFDASVMPRRSSWRRAFTELQQRAAVVVAEGPFMRSTLLGLGFQREQVEVVPISAGFEHLTFREQPVPEDAVRVISCGRLVEKKGHDLAIRAFAAAGLPKGSSLEIVGSGPREERLRDLIDELGLGSTVRMVGALRREVWLDHLSSSDLLVAASRQAANGDSEGGAPTTILDAQASGVTVVGSTHADIPFLVEEGVTGYLGPEGDVSGLAAALSRAVADRARWPTIRRTARQQVDERHATHAVVRALQAIHHRAARA